MRASLACSWRGRVLPPAILGAPGQGTSPRWFDRDSDSTFDPASPAQVARGERRRRQRGPVRVLSVEPPAPNAFALRLLVGPDDLDAQGHVSNVRVVDWMNRAAIAHSESLGLDLPRYRALGGTFVVRRHEIEYLAPAFEGDEVLAFTWARSCRRATAERRHEVRRVGDGRTLARGFNLWAWVDLTGRPARIPAAVEAAFAPAAQGT